MKKHGSNPLLPLLPCNDDFNKAGTANVEKQMTMLYLIITAGKSLLYKGRERSKVSTESLQSKKHALM